MKGCIFSSNSDIGYRVSLIKPQMSVDTRKRERQREKDVGDQVRDFSSALTSRNLIRSIRLQSVGCQSATPAIVSGTPRVPLTYLVRTLYNA